MLRQRLTGRRTEDVETLHRRLRNSRAELEHVDSYAYVIVNDDLDRALHDVEAVIDAEAVRRTRQPDLPDRVRALVTELDRILAES